MRIKSLLLSLALAGVAAFATPVVLPEAARQASAGYIRYVWNYGGSYWDIYYIEWPFYSVWVGTAAATSPY